MFEERLRQLEALLDALPGVLVAYSGGVDSAVLLRAAVDRLGDRALGVIADSPSLAREELRAATELARAMGASLEIISTAELENPDYATNPINRCYFCKSELFERMGAFARRRGFSTLAYGENADDPPGDRPGSRAAREFQVRAPLREAGLTKADVRALAARWGLSVADKPASPCLSSRIPHGIPVTREALARVEAGEQTVRALGFRIFRLRHHGDLARFEFASAELDRALAEPLKSRVIEAALRAGYRDAEIDPTPYGKRTAALTPP
ncbi:MAG: ATP-dependent sacrificial sulfur transferase LarE [Verrucomicrobiae bacterium]|nr:ATP-dependent sacrificial sulfur transferase LarE [Verrucomicrobiae bacterium]